MTRLADIQARHAAATRRPKRPTSEFFANCPDDVGWLLDRVTRLQEVANKAGAYRMIETGVLHSALGLSAPLPSEIEKARHELDRVLAALDTEQT